jgi:nucleotide-binding universal stress UspA family protein
MKILACTDLSDGAHQALVRAIALAAHSHGSLAILHAAPVDDGALNETCGEIRAFARSEAEAIGAAALDIHVHIRRQEPGREILAEAERSGADLIVLGGHGRPRFRDAIFGTVGTHVVRHSSVPVLIVQTDPLLPYSKLMVAADGPESAPRLVESALAIAPAAEVYTVHAFNPPLGHGLFCRNALDEAEREQEVALKAALSRMAGTQPQALLDAKGHLIVDEGDALTVMMDQTEQLVPDLVVLGTHHRGHFIGSRGVDAMFWCPADMLILPEPALAPAEA